MLRKALVIGGDPQIKVMLSNVLDPERWTVQDATDNVAALQLVRETKFDLVLTDQKTSGLEDLDFLRVIRRIHPHTRVIILTPERTSPDIVAAIRAGAF